MTALSFSFIYSTTLLFFAGSVLVRSQQVCKDEAINACVSYITAPVAGAGVTEQQINQSCSRLSELPTCLPKNGCPADSGVTLQVKNAIHSGVSKLCAVKRDRLVTAANCWGTDKTRNKITACNTTFIANLLASTPFCDAAGAYMTCAQNAVLTDCGPETMIYHSTFTHSVLVGYTITRNCTIWNNQCLPWNITSCLTNLNTQLSWTTIGKNTLRSNLDKLCRRQDDVSTCLTSQRCPTSNSFYQLVYSKLDSSYSALCEERDKTSSYNSYADCWTKDSVKSGLTTCNNTLKSSLDTSYCSSVNTFLQCTQGLVSRECSTDSARYIAAYFYALFSINATVNNCALDSTYSPAAVTSSSTRSGSTSGSTSSYISSVTGSTYKPTSMHGATTSSTQREPHPSTASHDQMTPTVIVLVLLTSAIWA